MQFFTMGFKLKLENLKLLFQFFRDERTVKFFSPSPILIRKIESDPVLMRRILKNHRSDPVLIHPRKNLYFHFASRGKIDTAFWHFQNLTRQRLFCLGGKSIARVILPLGKRSW